MSGGGIGNQSNDEDRQVVIFTFSGELDSDDVKAWNAAIKGFKERFGSRLAGVTMLGDKKSDGG